MIRKKLVSWFSFLIFMVALLSAQSLVELAKKEKERRAKLKKKSSVVVTNADLARIKKKPAVEVTTLPPPPSDKSQTPEPTSSSPQIRVIDRTASAPKPKKISVSEGAEVDQQETSGSLEEQLKRVQELVGLLTLKMNALWQEFYSLDDMTPRDLIQKQISETYLQLQKAKAEEERLKKQLQENNSRR